MAAASTGPQPLTFPVLQFHLTERVSVAIGSSLSHGMSKTNAGHVRVFGWDSGSWGQVGADIDGEGARRSFRPSRLSVSQWRACRELVLRSGPPPRRVECVFKLDGDSWVYLGDSIEEEPTGTGSAGSSMSTVGTERLAVGAFYDDATGTKTESLVCSDLLRAFVPRRRV